MSLNQNPASKSNHADHLPYYHERNRLFINYLVAFLSMPVILNLYNFFFLGWSNLQAQTYAVVLSGGALPGLVPGLRTGLLAFISPQLLHIFLPILALVIAAMALAYVSGASPLIRTEALRTHLALQESLLRRFMVIMSVIMLVSLIPMLSGFGLNVQHPFHARPYTIIWAFVAEVACFYYSLKFLFRFIIGMHVLNEHELKPVRYSARGKIFMTILEFVIFVGVPVAVILYFTSKAVAAH